MQVRVTPKARGEFFVRALGKTFRVGSKIPMSEDQFSDSTTQAAIRRGLLEVLGDAAETHLRGQYYRNIHKNNVSFRCIDMSVPAKAEFFVAEEFLDDPEIWLAESKGRIEKIDTPEPEAVEVEEVETEEAVEAEKPKKKRTRKKKTEKEAETDESVVEEPVQEVKADEGPETKLPDEEEVETPDGAYVHDPREDAEPMKVRRVKKPDPTWVDRPKTTDLFDDSPDLDFVDESKGTDLDFVDSNGEVE